VQPGQHRCVASRGSVAPGRMAAWGPAQRHAGAQLGLGAGDSVGRGIRCLASLQRLQYASSAPTYGLKCSREPAPRVWAGLCAGLCWVVLG
jgi:hypothetical protein